MCNSQTLLCFSFVITRCWNRNLILQQFLTVWMSLYSYRCKLICKRTKREILLSRENAVEWFFCALAVPCAPMSSKPAKPSPFGGFFVLSFASSPELCYSRLWCAFLLVNETARIETGRACEHVWWGRKKGCWGLPQKWHQRQKALIP